jgi:acetolactate synthase-1/3 small subunit
MSDDRELEKAEKQLNTLVEVVKVSTLHKSSSIVRDLCLVRINATDVRRREEVMQMVNAYGAKIVDVSLNALTVEIVNEPRKIDKFIEMAKGYGIKQLLRTGVTAIAMDGANGGSANGGLK